MSPLISVSQLVLHFSWVNVLIMFWNMCLSFVNVCIINAFFNLNILSFPLLINVKSKLKVPLNCHKVVLCHSDFNGKFKHSLAVSFWRKLNISPVFLMFITAIRLLWFYQRLIFHKVLSFSLLSWSHCSMQQRISPQWYFSYRLQILQRKWSFQLH